MMCPDCRKDCNQETQNVADESIRFSDAKYVFVGCNGALYPLASRTKPDVSVEAYELAISKKIDNYDIREVGN